MRKIDDTNFLITYDPALGRWHVIDPAIENNHYEHSPYIYVYNDPVRLIDPFGLDSLQRAQAVNASNADVNANDQDDPEEYNNSDCSTTLESWMNAAGGSYKNAPWEDNSGAATIKKNVEEKSKTNEQVGIVEDDEVEAGYGYIWKREDGSYHAAIVAEVIKDEDGNITEIAVNHSEFNRGFRQDRFDPNDKNSRWVKRSHSYFKWDSKPETVKAKIPAATIVGKGQKYATPITAPIILK